MRENCRYRPVDIVLLKRDIKDGYIEMAIHDASVLLRDVRSGEAVKIGELPAKDGGNND